MQRNAVAKPPLQPAARKQAARRGPAHPRPPMFIRGGGVRPSARSLGSSSGGGGRSDSLSRARPAALARKGTRA